MITLTCECGKVYQLKDELAGKRGKCSCGKSLVIPQAPATQKPTRPTTAKSPSPQVVEVIQSRDDTLASASQHGQGSRSLVLDCTTQGSEKVKCIDGSTANSTQIGGHATSEFAELLEFHSGEVAVNCEVRKGSLNELYHWYAVCPDSLDCLSTLLGYFKIPKETVLRVCFMTQWDQCRGVEKVRKTLEIRADVSATFGPLFEALRTRQFGRALRVYSRQLFDFMLTYVVGILVVGAIIAGVLVLVPEGAKDFPEEHPGIMALLFACVIPISFIPLYRLSKPGPVSLVVLTAARAYIFTCKLVPVRSGQKQFQLMPKDGLAVNFRCASSNPQEMKLASKWIEEVDMACSPKADPDVMRSEEERGHH